MPDATFSQLFSRNLREARTKDHKEIHNLLQRQSTLFGPMVAREEADFTVKGDPEKWTLLANGTDMTRRRNPKDPLGIEREGKAVKAQVGLRIYVNPLPEVEYERDIQSVDENQFASQVEMEIAQQSTQFVNFVDDDLLAPPDSDMENVNDKSAPIHSLPTIICPDANGLPSGFTTMMGVAYTDVAANKWQPVVKTYTDAFDFDNGIVEALCAAMDEIKFDKIALREVRDPKFRETNISECGIISGYRGKSMLRRYNARNNDQHGLELAKDGSTIRGRQLICVSALDTKNLDYRTSYTDNYPDDEPAFFLPNFKDIHLIAHEKHWMRHVRKDMGARQYDVSVDILESWMGVRARRRDTSAYVGPATAA